MANVNSDAGVKGAGLPIAEAYLGSYKLSIITKMVHEKKLERDQNPLLNP